MDILDEENPLHIETESSNKHTTDFRNNVGRPTKKNEILFSAPPKSIISLLLREEKGKKIKENKTYQPEISINQNETSILEEKTIKLVKKWKCEHCTKRIFYKKSEYKKHLMSHKVYRCDYSDCSYSTKFTSNLKTHKRIHTSDYPYVCDECTFRTKFINSLKTHKRLHNTDRPFGCQHCDYKCNSGSNLKKHSMRKHSNVPNNN